MQPLSRARFRQRSDDPFWRNRRSFLFALAGTLLSAIALSASVSAGPPGATVLVNSTSNTKDAAVGDGVCSTGVTLPNGQAECTLIAAISETEASPALTHIEFDIPTSDANHSGGVWTITPDNSSRLPPITSTVIIDASTQTPVGVAPRVLVDYSAISGGGANGLVLRSTAASSVIRGLSVAGANGSGILVEASGTFVESNFIGIRPDETPLPNAIGVTVTGGAQDVVLGGSAARAGNVVSGNTTDGVVVSDASTLNTRVENNHIGTNLAGSAAIPNGDDGIQVLDAETTTINSNVISANADGIKLDASNFSTVSDNTIRSSGRDGVYVNNPSGPTTVIDNRISANSRDGIRVQSSALPVRIERNEIHSNGGLAIDLGGDGHTPNDADDLDSGVNGRLNYPRLIANSREVATGTHTVRYQLEVPAGTYTVHFFTNPGGVDAYGEAETWVGSHEVTVPAGVSVHETGPLPIPTGSIVTAQTVMTLTGESSEMSAPRVIADESVATVNSTGDASDADPGNGFCETGNTNALGAPECTLRAAIEETNALSYADTVRFGIPLSDPGHTGSFFRIEPVTAYPNITETLSLDARTQPGYAGSPLIMVDGALMATGSALFLTEATDVLIAGFSIGHSPDDGLEIDGQLTPAHRNQLIANWIGLDPTGAPAPNNDIGILVLENANDTVIGGPGTAGNIIGHNTTIGIEIRLGPNDGSSIVGNHIGVTPTGTAAPNGAQGILIGSAVSNAVVDGNTIENSGGHGIDLLGATGTRIINNTIENNSSAGLSVNASTNVTVGEPTRGNRVSGNQLDGISITGGSDSVTVQNNTIGLDGANNPLGNGSSATDHEGIDVFNATNVLIGGTGLSEGNTIAYNSDGVSVTGATSLATVVGNSIYGNTGLAIDLQETIDALDTLDPLDLDTGGNGHLNRPVPTSVAAGLVTFDLDVPASQYRIELYRNPTFGSGAQQIVGAFTLAHPGTGVRSFTHPIPGNDGDSLTLTATVINPDSSLGATSEVSVPIVVVNTAHVVTAPGDQTTAEGDAVNIVPSVVPGGAAPITWSAVGLPPGLSINPSTGLMGGTPTFDAAGSYPVTITASSADAPSGNDSFTWTITNTNRPPATTNPGSQSNNDGDSVSLFVPATDPDAGDTLTWSATGLPTGLSINSATGEISGTVSAPTSQSYSTSVTVSDGTDLSIVSFGWDVAPTNLPPVITTTWNTASFPESSVVTMTIMATDPEGGALTWSAPGLPPALTLVPTTGFVSGTVDPDAVGVYPVTFTVTDDGGLTDTHLVTFTVTRFNAAPTIVSPGDQTHAENDAVSISIAAADPDSEDTLTYSASNLPDGVSIEPTTGLISGTLSYTSAGSYAVDVTVTDDGSPAQNDVASFAWTVDNTNRPVTLTHPGTQNHAEGAAVTLPISGSDPDGDTFTWSATNLPDGLAIDPATGVISGNLTSVSAGSYSASASAFDGTDSSSVFFTWNVTEPNVGPSILPIPPQLWTEQDVVTVTPIATDPNGDTLTWSAANLPAGLSINSATGQITGTLPYDSLRDVESTILVSDGSAFNSTFVDWSIADLNRPPVLSNPGDQSSAVGSAVTVTLVGADADGDALTFSAEFLLPGLTLDSTTGVITGSPSVSAYGTGPVIFTVDDGTDTDTVTITWDVPLASAPATTTSTTSTTVAPTTSTTIAAPATSLDIGSPPPTTSPPARPTEALPFSDFQAHDDEIVVTAAERIFIDVRANDVGGDEAQIVAVSAPEFGELEVVDGQLVLDMPEGFVGQFTFLYSVENPRGEVSSAAVKVFAASTVSIEPIDLEAAPVSDASEVLRRFGSLVLQVLRIDLTGLQVGLILLSPLVFLLLRYLFGRREELVAVTSVAFGSGAAVEVEDRDFTLRHDAMVWRLRSRRRNAGDTAQVKVETPTGAAWIDAELVVETGH